MSGYICPHCKKPTYDDDALRCIYCGELLNRRVGFLSGLRYSHVTVVLLLILIISFIIFFVIRL